MPLYHGHCNKNKARHDPLPHNTREKWKNRKKKSIFWLNFVFWGIFKISWCTFKCLREHERVYSLGPENLRIVLYFSRAFNTIVIQDGFDIRKINRLWPKLHILKIGSSTIPIRPAHFKIKCRSNVSTPPCPCPPPRPSHSLSLVWL